jgi:hypothetical protein
MLGDGILMFAFAYIEVSSGKWISQWSIQEGAMALTDRLSELEEKVLLALWKLRAIGKNHVRENVLRADLSQTDAQGDWQNEISSLNDRSLLEVTAVDGQREIFLTPLGLSLIRQIEEDKLQELK